MNTRQNSWRAKRKPPFERFKDHCRQFTAFMFSNVGIIILVIFYTIGGAFIFQAIEIFEYERLQKQQQEQEQLQKLQILHKQHKLFNEHQYQHEHHLYYHNSTKVYLQYLWQVTAKNIAFLDQNAFKKRVNEILLQYQRDVVHKQLTMKDVEKQWSFSGAFLYSLTVITTIGYGNISPRSDWGKIVTIIYAIFGMPLFLLYLSNIGDVLAKSFKWIYSKVCLCRICPGVAKRRLIRERRKLRELSKNKVLTDMVDFESAQCSRKIYTKNNICNNKKGDSSFSSSNCSSSSSNNDNATIKTTTTSTTTTTTTASSECYNKCRSPTSIKIHDPLMTTLIHNRHINYNDNNNNGDDDYESDIEREIRGGSIDEITVSLWVCVFIMISYIMWGALLFGRWEDWGYLDGSYFCFISLSSIGFGDLVPGERVITADKDKVEVSFILCAIYLLLGMALIAMCFNLMQEQVIRKMRGIKRAFKACFRCR